MSIDDALALGGGLATTRQLLQTASYRVIARRLREGTLFRAAHGVYSSDDAGHVDAACRTRPDL